MSSTTLFRSNRTQAVRLPKEVAFPAGVREVEILVVGNARLIVPKGKRWSSYFEHGPFVDEDFLRHPQPPARKRGPL
jgi:antitoxin VapB